MKPPTIDTLCLNTDFQLCIELFMFITNSTFQTKLPKKKTFRGFTQRLNVILLVMIDR